MDSKELRGIMEAYSQMYAPQEDTEQLDEISYDLALRASKAADIKRGKLAHAGDKEGASEKAAQAARLYKKQAAKRLNREDVDIFDTVLEFLQAEGFAETLEEAEWMMANIIDEEAIDIILGEGKKEFPHKKVDRQVYDAMDSGETAGDSGDRAKMKRDYGRAERMRSVAAKHGGKTRARTNEEFVDESQHARENPEKYEREQSKKYAPVRGEKTPMPPRGDKRREDFEKWYRTQMGR